MRVFLFFYSLWGRGVKGYIVFQSAMLIFSPHVQGEGLADPSTKDNNNYLSSLGTEHYFNGEGAFLACIAGRILSVHKVLVKEL